jgi:peroxiredoxin
MLDLAQLEAEAEQRWLASWLAGPMRTRYEELPPQPGDAAPDLELPDTSGGPRRLSEFWAHGPALVIFLRHFGCSCLAERWDSLSGDVPVLEAAGAQVVAICQAEPPRALAVATRRSYPFPLLCDPERTSYAAFGLLEGSPAQVVHDFPWRSGDPVGAQAMGLDARRGTERAFVDSPWQLPGEFVIGSDGRIVHAHRAQFCEDFPPRTVLLGAIAEAR